MYNTAKFTSASSTARQDAGTGLLLRNPVQSPRKPFIDEIVSDEQRHSKRELNSFGLHVAHLQIVVAQGKYRSIQSRHQQENQKC